VKEGAFEEDLFQEIRDDSNRIKEQNIDSFFTFSRKNEEFQELLDKEYEKFNMYPTVPEVGTVREVVSAPIEPVKVIKESGIPEAVPLQEIHIEAEISDQGPAMELAGESLN